MTCKTLQNVVLDYLFTFIFDHSKLNTHTHLCSGKTKLLWVCWTHSALYFNSFVHAVYFGYNVIPLLPPWLTSILSSKPHLNIPVMHSGLPSQAWESKLLLPHSNSILCKHITILLSLLSGSVLALRQSLIQKNEHVGIIGYLACL